MTKQIVENLRILSQIVGVSSREKRVVKELRKLCEPFADDMQEDRSGNLLVTLKGTQKDGPILMLDAHTDEIGLMVRHISADGFIYFAKIGGFVDLLFAGQTVVFAPDDESKPLVYGVIGIKPPHMTKGGSMEIPPASEYTIDVGASSFAEVQKLGIDVGTTGTLVGEFRELPYGRVLGKAFDDRTGCVVLLETLRRLHKKRPTCTVVFNFASAEEVGGRGATTAAFTVNPDIALAIENTTAGDMPGVASQDCPCKLGAGPAITVADRSLIVNEKILSKLKELATVHKIPWQYKKPMYGGTDAGRIALARGGIPSAVVSVPCRYIHSPISLLVIKDLSYTCDLVEAFTRTAHEIV